MRLRAPLAVLAATLLVLPPLAAQGAGGVRLSAGLGPGSFRVSCPAICAGGRDWGLAGFASAGLDIGRGFGIGLSATGWRDSEGTGDEELRSRAILVGPSLQWQPRRGSGPHFVATLGWFTYRRDDVDDPDTEAITASTLGGEVRIGYDIGLGRRTALTPWVGVAGSTGGRLRAGDATVVRDATFSLLHAGIAFSLR